MPTRVVGLVNDRAARVGECSCFVSHHTPSPKPLLHTDLRFLSALALVLRLVCSGRCCAVGSHCCVVGAHGGGGGWWVTKCLRVWWVRVIGLLRVRVRVRVT